MAYSYDGYLRFNTEVDQSGFEEGVSNMQSAAIIAGNAISTGVKAAMESMITLSKYGISFGANYESAMNIVATLIGASTTRMDGLEES